MCGSYENEGEQLRQATTRRHDDTFAIPYYSRMCSRTQVQAAQFKPSTQEDYIFARMTFSNLIFRNAKSWRRKAVQHERQTFLS